MILRFWRFLFGDVPFEMTCTSSLEDSVQRLRGATKRSVFSSLFSETAVGRVTVDSVRLQRVIPMFGNSFKPVFVGKFQELNGCVVLKGKFTMFLFSKIFMSIWLGFVLFWTILASLSIFGTSVVDVSYGEKPLLALLFPLVGLGFFLVGIIFVRFCWWFSRNDITYLINVISQALQNQPGEASVPCG